MLTSQKIGRRVETLQEIFSEIQAKNRAVTPLVVKPTNTLYDRTISTSMKSPHTKMSIL